MKYGYKIMMSLTLCLFGPPCIVRNTCAIRGGPKK